METVSLSQVRLSATALPFATVWYLYSQQSALPYIHQANALDTLPYFVPVRPHASAAGEVVWIVS